MRNTVSTLALTFAFAATACADAPRSPAEPETFTAPVLQEARTVDVGNFHAHARGREEVPPVDTRAQGQATFKLSKDGTSLSYKLNVANIEDVLMAHIHAAPPGENGGIVVWLYPVDGSAPELIPGRFQGTLAEGVITADDLTGSLEGATLDALVDLLRSGGAYVNVHTIENPGGEVRGQIR